MAKPDYVFDHSNWEITYEWGQRDELVMDDPELEKPGDVKRFSTLIEGPDKFAARVPISEDETEIRWFDSEAEARTACGMPPHITAG